MSLAELQLKLTVVDFTENARRAAPPLGLTVSSLTVMAASVPVALLGLALLVGTWPRGIEAEKTPRTQFHHLNDVVPTLYEVIGIKPPQVVDGFKQDPIDGVSLAYTFGDATARGRKKTQYFENNGSRGIYHDGWYACTFGPLTPWLTVSPGLATWDASTDRWELYNLAADFSQYEDLASKEPERLARMKELFTTID